jgi:hypothetical protein
VVFEVVSAAFKVRSAPCRVIGPFKAAAAPIVMFETLLVLPSVRPVKVELKVQPEVENWCLRVLCAAAQYH